MSYPKSFPSFLIGSVVAGLAAYPAAAQTVTKANNTTSLNFGASYVGGVAPTGTNTVLIDNTLTGTSLTAGIGTGISVLGVNFTAAPVSGTARAFTISSSGTSTLAIGAGGLTKAANTSTFLIQAPIVLTADQTWDISSVTGGGTGNLGIQGSILDGGFTANVTGTGRIDFTANTVTVGNGIILNTAQVVVNGASAVVNFGNANTSDNYLIASGRAVGSTFGNFGVAGSFGDGGTATAITLGGNGTSGIFDYNGADISSNRTFNFDRRGASSEIRNSNASSTLTLSGIIQNSSGTSAAGTTIAFGGDGNITLTGTEQIKDNINAGDATTLNKNGNGILTITGANSNSNTTNGTYQGATNVNAGTLIVSGTGSINSTSGIAVAVGATFEYNSSTALTKAITNNGTVLIDGVVNSALTLNSGSRVGGDGTISTGLAIGSGVDFVFSMTDTLTVSGLVTLDNSFGVDDLVNADGSAINWSLVSDGNYVLIDNGSSFGNIQNFGLANAADIGGGRLAYFQQSSLELVVVPEPGTAGLLTAAGLVVLVFRRRRSAF
jgi:hypothetical protein